MRPSVIDVKAKYDLQQGPCSPLELTDIRHAGNAFRLRMRWLGDKRADPCLEHRMSPLLEFPAPRAYLAADVKIGAGG